MNLGSRGNYTPGGISLGFRGMDIIGYSEEMQSIVDLLKMNYIVPVIRLE